VNETSLSISGPSCLDLCLRSAKETCLLIIRGFPGIKIIRYDGSILRKERLFK